MNTICSYNNPIYFILVFVYQRRQVCFIDCCLYFCMRTFAELVVILCQLTSFHKKLFVWK